jgi:hypothetical protein
VVDDWSAVDALEFIDIAAASVASSDAESRPLRAFDGVALPGERAGVRAGKFNLTARASGFKRAPWHSGHTSRSLAQLHQLSSIESAFAPRSTSGM